MQNFIKKILLPTLTLTSIAITSAFALTPTTDSYGNLTYVLNTNSYTVVPNDNLYIIVNGQTSNTFSLNNSYNNYFNYNQNQSYLNLVGNRF